VRRAHIEHLLEIESERKPGYVEACLARGRWAGGGWLEFTEETHTALRREFGGKVQLQFRPCWHAERGGVNNNHPQPA
jgi:hypothetical protein